MSKQKTTKNVEVVSVLKAFETTLKAASRQNGIALYKPLLEQLQQCQEESKTLRKVVLVGGHVHDGHVHAVADCLASYAAVYSLSCLGCRIGDKGLSSLAALLKASSNKWWRGCRLQVLELSGCQPPLTPAGAPGSGRVTTASRLPGGALRALNDPVTQSSSCGSSGSLTRPATAPAAAHQGLHPGQHHCKLTGLCPPVPSHLQLADSQRAEDDGYGSLREIHYTFRPPRPLLEIRAWALAPTMDPQKQKHQSPTSTESDQAAAAAQHPPQFGSDALRQLSLSLGASGLSLARLVLDFTMLSDVGVSILSEGLSSCSSLKVLSLRHCGIGPAGAQQLAAALMPPNRGRNSSLSAGRLSFHVGGSMIRSTEAHLPVHSTPVEPIAKVPGHAAPGVSASASTTITTTPQLVELQLDGNPMRGPGLQHLSYAFRTMTGLKVLSVADIGIDNGASSCNREVQEIVHALQAGAPELETLDFDSNNIGDENAMFFMGLLKAKPSLLLVKLTARISSTVMAQLSELMEEHQRDAKAARMAKKKKAG